MARESVQQVDIPPTIPQAEITPPESIEALWQEISPRKPQSDKEVKQICPIPLVFFCVVSNWVMADMRGSPSRPRLSGPLVPKEHTTPR